ncbi:MAG: cobalamin-dependent protein [Tetrasphaera sp.]
MTAVATPTKEHLDELPAPTVVVTSVASDSHMWNLVYVQLLVEELGYRVVNLGPCTPEALVIEACRLHAADLLVVSTVNGHGYLDGLRLITALRECADLGHLPAVIGGKLGIHGGESVEALARLTTAGFDAVFEEQVHGTSGFVELLARGAQRRELN